VSKGVKYSGKMRRPARGCRHDLLPDLFSQRGNGYDVKVVKLEGESVGHSHPETDELFLVLSGELTIQLRDRDVVLGQNDIFVVPCGVEGTIDTGDVGGERTAQLRELDA
jgi:mannose-6-phosphate isomerase-like protein (cupin superfamily)